MRHLVLALGLPLFALSSPAFAQYIKVDPVDIAVGTRKYLDKDIEFSKVNCYYADVGDFRCVTGESVSVFAKDITPPEAKARIEANCGQLKKIRSAPCTASIRFRLNESDIKTDTVSNGRKRTVIDIDTVQLVMPRRN